jgi:SPASM domain peptide maturase of grasp-with-spasm system
METDDLIFRLFACCVPVRGARRSVICDLQRGSYQLIPNGLFDILREQAGRTVGEIKTVFEHEYDVEIDEYFAFLLAQDLGFWCDEPERFPELDLTWEAPERITNALIDVAAGSEHDFPKLFAELDDLGCKALQLRFFAPVSGPALAAILASTRQGRLRSIELLVPAAPALDDAFWIELCRQHPRLSQVLVHGAAARRRVAVPDSAVAIDFHPERVTSAACCGQVSPRTFSINLEHFTEAQAKNSCLNRKVSIDAAGEIKNCPSFGRSFGNAREVSLHGAVARRDFQELWEVNKDQIEVCKDCEFRYLCTDCRAYVSDVTNRLSKPAKCRYDPYTAEWRPDFPLHAGGVASAPSGERETP